jgi:hypothetical protein
VKLSTFFSDCSWPYVKNLALENKSLEGTGFFISKKCGKMFLGVPGPKI